MAFVIISHVLSIPRWIGRPRLLTRTQPLLYKPRQHFHYTYGSVRRPYPSYINSTSNHAGECKNAAPTFQRRSADISGLTLTQHGQRKWPPV
jgi:hypothetical protein